MLDVNVSHRKSKFIVHRLLLLKGVRAAVDNNRALE